MAEIESSVQQEPAEYAEPCETLYCQCGFPVSYCRFRSAAKLKSFGCKEYLAGISTELYAKLYGEPPPEVAEPLAYPLAEGHEEEEDEDEEEDGEEEVQKLKIPIQQVPPFGFPIKPHLKRVPTYVPILQIRLASRGQRKSLTQVFNSEDFVDDAAAICKEIGKKFSASAGVSQLPDTQVEVIQIQGSFAYELREYFIALGVPADQIYYAQEGKHKGKKKSQRNSRPRDKK